MQVWLSYFCELLLGRYTPIERLPEHIRIRIRAQEHESEVLIGWVQILLALTFTTLYSLTPKAADSGVAGLQPVPWVLGIYITLTVVRIAWASVATFRPWPLTISAVFDMGLLMVLIWSFHIQYAQPPSFYLKAPTLLYVFIFISLRALRFDPRYVLITGMTGVVGWGLLVINAVVGELGTGVITRNYIEYMTGNKILLGAEFDKMFAIIVVTLILTMALARARRLLVLAVTEGSAARELARFFAPEVARRITGGGERIVVGQGETCEAAIVMIDLRGFTQLTAILPPYDVLRLLGDYQQRIVPVIREHGGSIDKFLGDGIMATFGTDRAANSYAADALAAADAVLDAMEEWNRAREASGAPPLGFGIAVTTGRVIFGAIGDDTRLEYTVIGDPVNLASKLEKHNKAEGTRALTTLDTFELARRQGYAGDRAAPVLAARQVAGVDHVLDLVALCDSCDRGLGSWVSAASSRP